MFYLSVDLLIDALVLMLHTTAPESRHMVQRLIEIYEIEDKNSTLSENEFCKLYIGLIREVMSLDLQIDDQTAIESFLLKFKSNPAVLRDPELYTTLKKIFTDKSTFNKDRQEYLERKINNAIVWYANSKYVRKMFGRLSNNTADPLQQEQILKELSEICSNIIKNNEVAIKPAEDENQARFLDFQSKETIRKALTVYNNVAVTNKFITGWKALNRALGGGYALGSSIVFNSRSHNGKALVNGTPVKIPGGWKNIEDLKVGEYVIGQDGKPAEILGVFPQGKRPIMRVTFEDGRWIDVDRDHLWSVWPDPNCSIDVSPEVLSTFELAYGLTRGCNWYIPLNLNEVRPSSPELPLHPYILGALLSGNSGGEFSLPVVKQIERLRPPEVQLFSRYDDNLKGYRGIITDNGDNPAIRNLLMGVGMDPDRPHERFIPESYLDSDHTKKYELLQGLFDVDNVVSTDSVVVPGSSPYVKRLQITYRTKSERLAKDVQRLLWSIGETVCALRPSATAGEFELKIRSNNAWFFFTQRRREELGLKFTDTYSASVPAKLQITSIEYLEEEDDATCIYVDNSNHLFVTKDYIVTHNTLMLLKMARWQVTLNKVGSTFHNPTCILYSLENETPQNLMLMFRDLYIQKYKRVPPADMPEEQIINFCYDEFSRYGWKLVIDRRLGADFGFADLVANFEGYVRLGYTPLMCIVDYANMMSKNHGDSTESSTNNLQIKELYTNLCNYLKAHNCTFVTAHQLNRRADEAVRMNPVGAVKRFGPDMLSDSISVQREVDIVFYQNKELDAAGNAYLTFKADKNRYNNTIPDKDKYFAYPFMGELGILDDLERKDGSCTNIYSYPFQEAMEAIKLEAEEIYRAEHPGEEDTPATPAEGTAETDNTPAEQGPENTDSATTITTDEPAPAEPEPSDDGVTVDPAGLNLF